MGEVVREESGDKLLITVVAIAVLFFVASSVAFGYLVVFGENLSGQPGSVYTISLREYEIEPNPDPIIVRVGEPVIFRLVNEGAVEHEFMFVMDIEQMASMIEKAAIRLANERPDLSEEEIITMVLEVHDEAMLEMIEKTLGNVIIADTYMVELEPGESEVLRVTFREPGIYVVACFEMEGTFPNHMHPQACLTR